MAFNMLAFASGAYALLLLFYFGLRLIVGESSRIVALGNSLLPALLIPSVFLLIIMLLRHRLLGHRLIAVLLLPTVVFFIVSYGQMFLPVSLRAHPTTSAAESLETNLSVLTFNIASKQDHFEGILATIRELNADVVAIQEMHKTSARVFEAELRDLYPYQVLYPSDSPSRGVGVLSKYPTSEAEPFFRLIFGGVRVRLALPNRDIIFYNVHPASPGARTPFDTKLRSAETKFILDDTAQFEDVPTVLVGDFNATDQSDDYGRVRAAGFRDTFREAGYGLGPTFPNSSHALGELGVVPPLLRIDYVFFRTQDAWNVHEARVISDSRGSDHYPVYAVLGIQN